MGPFRRRTLLTGAAALTGAAIPGSAAAHQLPLPPLPPPDLPTLPGLKLPALPGVLGELLELVTELSDVLLLGAIVPIDGSTTYQIADKVAYADLPGNPFPDRLPHGVELIRYKILIVKQLTRTGDTDLTTVSQVLVVPVDARGAMLTSWRNPIDGKLRPVKPTLLRGWRRTFKVIDGRMQLGTPDVMTGSIMPQNTPAGTLLWSSTLIKSHNLSDRLGISEDFGLSGNVTTSVTEYLQISQPGRLPLLPVQTACMRQLTFVEPFAPELALDPSEVRGQMVTRESVVPISGLSDAPAWLRELVRTQYPELVAAPAEHSPGYDDTWWSAFYRDHLEPSKLTWQEWREASVIAED